MKQAHLLISGSVQGVGYRYFVKQNATNLNLTGWVRNIEDGRVEGVFQGEEKAIEEMIKVCKEGPYMAQVKQVEAEWEEISDTFTEFTIQ